MARMNLVKVVNQGGGQGTRGGRNSLALKARAGDIRLSHEQHRQLMQFITAKLAHGKQLRDTYIEVFRYIDREFYAYLTHDEDDRKRMRDNLKSRSVKPTDEKLSMLFSQLDEGLTYLLSVLAPDKAIYSAIAPLEKQPIADGFAALMNRHAQFFDHYGNFALFLLDCLRYNLGINSVFWETVKGDTVINNMAGQPETKTIVIEAGNEVIAQDPYNTLLDPTVKPHKMATHGSFFATIDIETEFSLLRLEEDGLIYNAEQFMSKGSEIAYYEEHPEIRSDMISSHTGETDWTKLLSYGVERATQGFEVINLYMWLQPKKYGLSARETYQIWQFRVGNAMILSASPVENAHGMLPVNVSTPFPDHAGWQTKSVGERLIPHQRFGSFTMNVHQRAERKRLVGTTFYDANAFPQLRNEGADLAGGRIPMENAAADADINKKIKQVFDAPDTSRTLENLEAMNALMQQIMPTDMLRQVAQLDRATQYQAAATVQSANRRNLKIARMINSQAMETNRRMQMYNIYQFAQPVEILDGQGNLVKINPFDFRDTRIEFTVDDGLKGIDRLAVQLNMKELIAMVVQSQQATAQTDIMALLNYLSTLLGDYTDFNQFKLKSPIDQLPKEQRDMAFQLLQQAMAAAEQQQAAGALPAQQAAGAPQL